MTGKAGPARRPPASKAAAFLLDVHTEPLPARFVAPALEQLRAGALAWLAGRVDHGEARAYGTLRHLVLAVDSVAPRARDAVERFKGPREQAWRAPEGGFTAAAEGFARKHGLSAADLKPEGGVLYAELHRRGESAAALLAAMVPELLKGLQFPKSMSWESSGFRFGRPIRALTALYGSQVVPLEIAGVVSGREVHGHPARARAPRPLKDPARHLEALRAAQVVADPSARRRLLLEGLAAAGRDAGGAVDLDEALVEETVFMTELPAPVVGRLRGEHLRLPAALLKMVMKKQLKFFPVLDKGGAVLPKFVGVRDGPSRGDALVREGYQRVLDARFNDAAFFFRRDCAARLDSRLPLLERVTYQKALGTLAQRAARVENIAGWLARSLRESSPVDERVVEASARLAFADLVTEVVKEFPELQGAMGGVYARRDGLGEEIARAVEQFYLPAAAKGPLPATAEARIVSLAGKLDGLAGCFAANLIPTGSADPFALRRQALGAARILLEGRLPVSLEAALAHALGLQPASPPEPARLQAQLADFVWGRAASYFEEQGCAPDEIRAVRAGALQDLPAAALRLKALRAVRRDPSFEPLAAAFKRASNILKQARGAADGVDPERGRLADEADLSLYDSLRKVEDAAEGHIRRGDYEGALKSLAAIKPDLDNFFDKVMVMVDDESLRRQRLAVLSRLVRAFKRVADISEIQPSAPREAP